MNRQDPFMGIDDLAEYCPLCKRKLREMVKEMEHHRYRHRLVIRKSAFDAGLEKYLKTPRETK